MMASIPHSAPRTRTELYRVSIVFRHSRTGWTVHFAQTHACGNDLIAARLLCKTRWIYLFGTRRFLSIDANSSPVSHNAVMPSIAPSVRLRGFYVIGATPAREIAREGPCQLGFTTSTAKQK
jgi:hypothetical protein